MEGRRGGGRRGVNVMEVSFPFYFTLFPLLPIFLLPFLYTSFTPSFPVSPLFSPSFSLPLRSSPSLLPSCSLLCSPSPLA